MRLRLLLSLMPFVFSSCEVEPKDYVTLSGKITNFQLGEPLKITDGKGYEKLIAIEANGSFKDTLKIMEGDYRFFHGSVYGLVYLKNNNVSSFTFDYNDFMNSLNFGGDGSENNNFRLQSRNLGSQFFPTDLFFDVTREDIDKAISDYKAKYEQLKLGYGKVDSLYLANADAVISNTIASVEQFYSAKVSLLNDFPVGDPSPSFNNYESHDGKTVSFSDFKGKYIYIDIWATWSKKSVEEFPHLKALRSKYEGDNIAFVSISVDDTSKAGSNDIAHRSWKEMVVDQNLEGIQLFSDKGWQSEFITSYKVSGLPRYILVDPKGNIVSPDAPSPSSPKLMVLLDSLPL